MNPINFSRKKNALLTTEKKNLVKNTTEFQYMDITIVDRRVPLQSYQLSALGSALASMSATGRDDRESEEKTEDADDEGAEYDGPCESDVGSDEDEVAQAELAALLDQMRASGGLGNEESYSVSYSGDSNESDEGVEENEPGEFEEGVDENTAALAAAHSFFEDAPRMELLRLAQRRLAAESSSASSAASSATPSAAAAASSTPARSLPASSSGPSPPRSSRSSRSSSARSPPQSPDASFVAFQKASSAPKSSTSYASTQSSRSERAVRRPAKIERVDEVEKSDESRSLKKRSPKTGGDTKNSFTTTNVLIDLELKHDRLKRFLRRIERSPHFDQDDIHLVHAELQETARAIDALTRSIAKKEVPFVEMQKTLRYRELLIEDAVKDGVVDVHKDGVFSKLVKKQVYLMNLAGQ